MTIPDEIIDEIRERVNLVEIAGDYLSLKKSGESFKALCPFHVEKTPSFVISQKKQIFHCFGCGVGGNVFTLVMKMENIDFPEAVKRLAERVGIVLPGPSGRTRSRDGLYEINEFARHFYRQNLETPEGKVVLRYLEGRGLNSESIARFSLGYAPKGWAVLRDSALSKGFKLEEMERAGLVIKKERSTGTKEDFYDRFRERLIFPIQDVQARVVGFGARILGEGTPKYINSPETAIYNKSQILYGMNLARGAIRDSGQAIIVEGYIDVITLHQHGFGNAVGSCGTALTQGHARILARFGRGAVLIYDPDAAGMKAALRGLDVLNGEGLWVKVVELPEGLDPADFLTKRGEDGFKKRLSLARSLFDYRLVKAKEGVDIARSEGKAKVLEEVIPTIVNTKDPIEQHASIKDLAELLHLNEEIILHEVKSRQRGSSPSLGFKEYVRSEEKGVVECERSLVRLMLLEEGMIEEVCKELGDEEFVDPFAKKVVSLLMNSILHGSRPKLNEILDHLDEKERGILLPLVLREETGGKRCLVRAYINRMRENRLNQRIRGLKEKIDQASSTEESKDLRNLLGQYQNLVKEVKLLRQEA